MKSESLTLELYFFKIKTVSDTNCGFHGNQKCSVTVKCPYHYGVVKFQICWFLHSAHIYSEIIDIHYTANVLYLLNIEIYIDGFLFLVTKTTNGMDNCKLVIFRHKSFLSLLKRMFGDSQFLSSMCCNAYFSFIMKPNLLEKISS